MPVAKKLDADELTFETAKRIARYINTVFEGNISAAARAIVVDYNVLWRAVQPEAKEPPSTALLMKLAAHSQRTIDHWLT